MESTGPTLLSNMLIRIQQIGSVFIIPPAGTGVGRRPMTALLPVSLDLRRLPVAVAGHGEKALTRLAMIIEAGAIHPRVYAPDAPADFITRAEALGGVVVGRLPSDAELDDLRVLFVADLDVETARPLHDRAEAYKVLVNVEDVVPLCALQVPSVLRRGDLAIAISTAGASPSLAIAMKRELARLIGPEWAERTAAIRRLRMALRGAGTPPAAVKSATDEMIRREGWLPLGGGAPRSYKTDNDTAATTPTDHPRRVKA
jgi:precorrin-2 dehydrogenase/sirohydrochlorin ferrochelatase